MINSHSRAIEVQQIMRWFECDHLPQNLREVSRYFQTLAVVMAGDLPDGEELLTGLRKLLEAKDCFVRAAIERDDPRQYRQDVFKG